MKRGGEDVFLSKRDGGRKKKVLEGETGEEEILGGESAKSRLFLELLGGGWKGAGCPGRGEKKKAATKGGSAGSRIMGIFSKRRVERGWGTTFFGRGKGGIGGRQT